MVCVASRRIRKGLFGTWKRTYYNVRRDKKKEKDRHTYIHTYTLTYIYIEIERWIERKKHLLE
jgi:hypothetical protein